MASPRCYAGRDLAHRCDSHAARPRANVTRHSSALGRWELAHGGEACQGIAPLRPRVESAGANRCQCRCAAARLPTEEAPLIINFGAPFRLFAPGDSRRRSRSRQLHHRRLRHLSTRRVGRIFQRRPGQFHPPWHPSPRGPANRRHEEWGVCTGRNLRGICSRTDPTPVRRACGWHASSRLPDRALRDAHGRSARRARRRALRVAPVGGVARAGSIASIVQEVGWSQRHLIAQFKHEIGVSPKVFARMLRFGRVVRAIRGGENTDPSQTSRSRPAIPIESHPQS